MTNNTSNTPCVTQSCVLFPVFLLTGMFTIYLGMQTAFLVSDHSALQQAYTQQDKPLAQIEKIKAQLSALGTGTLNLAKQGNKDAQDIVQQLKKAGVELAPPAQQGAGTPPHTPADAK